MTLAFVADSVCCWRGCSREVVDLERKFTEEVGVDQADGAKSKDVKRHW